MNKKLKVVNAIHRKKRKKAKDKLRDKLREVKAKAAAVPKE